MIDIMKLEKKFKQYPNFIGISRELMPKIVDGRTTAVKAVRIYVLKKVLKAELKKSEIFPAKVDDTPTDVFELGDVRTFQVDKTAKFNPVPLGVSVGHWSITAGSLGMLYRDKYENIYAGSNAHVLCGDPTTETMIEKRICQPGPYHNPARDQIAGEYHWHDRILLPNQVPSNCATAKMWVWIWNLLSNKLDRDTILPPAVKKTVYNYQDFAVYKPLIPHEGWIADNSFSSDLPFIGHLFAGSEVVGIICKVKYAMDKGYTPLVEIAEVQLSDEVVGCSFWCNYRTRVIDTNAIIQVGGYGNESATFDDVILVHNDGTIRGGYSGSGWRKVNV